MFVQPLDGHKPHKTQQENFSPRLKKSSQMRLGEQPECEADVKKLCSKLGGTNNFAVIDCLQSDNLASIA